MTKEFVTLPREVVEQVLKAAEAFLSHYKRNIFSGCVPSEELYFSAARASLRAALKQPQANQPAMTPIAQRKLDSLLAEGYTISGYSVYHEQKHQHGFVTGAGLVGWWKPEGVEHVQPLGEQKLFAWISPRALEWGTRQSEKVVKLVCKAQPEYDFTEPLYTRPQPKREPLTESAIADIVIDMNGNEPTALFWRDLARAIESAHNIK